jgi:hypothetical protein
MAVVSGTAADLVEKLHSRLAEQLSSSEMQRLRLRFDPDDPAFAELGITWASLEAARRNITKVEAIVDEVGEGNLRVTETRLTTSQIPERLA